MAGGRGTGPAAAARGPGAIRPGGWPPARRERRAVRIWAAARNNDASALPNAPSATQPSAERIAAANAMAARTARPTTARSAGLRVALAGARSAGGWAAASQAGRSEVTPARSAWVRAASVWLTLASNSGLVTKPRTYADLSVLIMPSRSAWDARRRLCPPWPGTALFGPAIDRLPLQDTHQATPDSRPHRLAFRPRRPGPAIGPTP